MALMEFPGKLNSRYIYYISSIGIISKKRGVAQLGSAAGLGPVGRRFESYHPEICACSSVGLEYIATNDRVGGSSPSRRVCYNRHMVGVAQW